MHLSIEEQADDGLTAVKWCFYYFASRHELVLDHYIESSRPTKRHKFRTDRFWGRLERRSRTIHEAPAVPDHIKNKAIEKFASDLKVVLSI